LAALIASRKVHSLTSHVLLVSFVELTVKVVTAWAGLAKRPAKSTPNNVSTKTRFAILLRVFGIDLTRSDWIICLPLLLRKRGPCHVVG
jgi:hypothetical protein